MPSSKGMIERATKLSKQFEEIGLSCGKPENSYETSSRKHKSVIVCSLTDENRTLQIGERIPHAEDETHLRHFNFVNAPQEGPWSPGNVKAFAKTFRAGEVDVLVHEPSYSLVQHRSHENEEFIESVFREGKKAVMIQAEEPVDPNWGRSRILLTILSQKTPKSKKT